MSTIAWRQHFKYLSGAALKRWEEVSDSYDFSEGVRGRVCRIKHTFWQRLAASHEEQMLLSKILVLF